MWDIIFSEEIQQWFDEVDEDALESIYSILEVLAEIGPGLGRPYVDTIKESKHKNMKELRVQNKKRVFRLFFIFDPVRNAVMLLGGDKRGDKRFYKRMIPLADAIYDRYLSTGGIYYERV